MATATEFLNISLLTKEDYCAGDRVNLPMALVNFN